MDASTSAVAVGRGWCVAQGVESRDFDLKREAVNYKNSIISEKR